MTPKAVEGFGRDPGDLGEIQHPLITLHMVPHGECGPGSPGEVISVRFLQGEGFPIGTFEGRVYLRAWVALGNTHLDLWLSTRFVTNLWRVCVHVDFRLIFSLSKKHLGPSPEASLQADTQYSFNLQRKQCCRTVSLPNWS